MKKLVATIAIALGLTMTAFSQQLVFQGYALGPRVPVGWVLVNAVPMLSDGNSTGWFEWTLYNPYTHQTSLWWVAVY